MWSEKTSLEIQGLFSRSLKSIFKLTEFAQRVYAPTRGRWRQEGSHKPRGSQHSSLGRLFSKAPLLEGVSTPHHSQRKAECVSSDANLLFEFPEKDQLDKLINLYFGRLNIYVPLLHQPSFERDMNSGLHLRDLGFAQVVLMVCALACRCIDDPGDLLPSDISGGFKYFHQVLLLRKKLLVETSLYDLQYYCVRYPSRILYLELSYIHPATQSFPDNVFPAGGMELGRPSVEIRPGARITPLQRQ
jgi:hypothetical protein